MRILMLTQWFEPEPHFKGLNFARELRRRGHDIAVVTGFPNYPGGQLYAGYQIRAFQKEEMDGIPVLRMPLYPSHDRSRIGRILNYVSFALSASIGILSQRRPDVVYVYCPPGTAALPACGLRLFKGVPFVLDIQDLWPDTLAATGMLDNRFALKLIGLWQRVVYESAAHLTVLSNGFRDRLIERGVPAEKITVIPNWSPEPDGPSEVHPCSKSASSTLDRFNILFAGNMGPAQALGTVLQAARQIETDDRSVHFTFVGDGVDVGALRENAADLSNVTFLSRRPPSEMPQLFQQADALLVHLRDDALFRITIPSKTQAYLRAGKPILMGVRGDAAELVREADAGLPFTPEDPQSLIHAIRTLKECSPEQRAAMGRAGMAFYREHLSLSVGVERFEQVLRDAQNT